MGAGRQGDTENSLFGGSFPQMLIPAGAGAGREQEPGTQYGPPTWATGVQALELSPAAPGVHQQEAGSKVEQTPEFRH